MTIYLNENPLDTGEGLTLYQLRDRFKPGADVLIVNGFALSDDRPLAEGDRVVLIRRGEQLSPAIDIGSPSTFIFVGGIILIVAMAFGR